MSDELEQQIRGQSARDRAHIRRLGAAQPPVDLSDMDAELLAALEDDDT